MPKSSLLLTFLFVICSLFACGGGPSDNENFSGTPTVGGGTDGGSGGDDQGDDGDVVTDDGVIRMGSGTGTSFTQGTIGATVSSLQAGDETGLSVTFVDSDGAPVSDVFAVTFSSNCVTDAIAAFSESTVNTVNGRATTDYQANGCSGDDTIRAVADIDGVDVLATTTINIAPDTVLGVSFVEVSESRISIAGLGGKETTDVTFQLVGATGAPIVGETVSFEVSNTIGGTRIAEGRESAVTDTAGLVKTTVQSGTSSSTFNVAATHDTSGLSGRSTDISISTGVPVQSRFDLSYSPFNPAAAETNGVTVSITASVADQLGNPPPDGARVSFRSVESGSVDPFCELINGTCSVTWTSGGDRTAASVIPDVSGRGYRVTVIGFMSGAEDFNDVNGNNLFDFNNSTEAASLQDLPEAYVDANENGSYDFGENIIDSFLNDPAPTPTTDGGVNEVYDAVGDGIYNGPVSCGDLEQGDVGCPLQALRSTIISDQVVIAMSSIGVAICDLGNLPGTSGTLTNTSIIGVELCDINGNSLPVGTVIASSVKGAEFVTGGGSVEVSGRTTEPNPLPVATVRADEDVETDGFFEITVTVPGENAVIYSWSIPD